MAAWAAPVPHCQWFGWCRRGVMVSTLWLAAFLHHHCNALGCATQFPFPVAQDQGQRQTQLQDNIPASSLAAIWRTNNPLTLFCAALSSFSSHLPLLPPLLATLWRLFRGFRTKKTPVAVADATPGCKFPLNVHFCTSF